MHYRLGSTPGLYPLDAGNGPLVVTVKLPQTWPSKITQGGDTASYGARHLLTIYYSLIPFSSACPTTILSTRISLPEQHDDQSIRAMALLTQKWERKINNILNSCSILPSNQSELGVISER